MGTIDCCPQTVLFFCYRWIDFLLASHKTSFYWPFCTFIPVYCVSSFSRRGMISFNFPVNLQQAMGSKLWTFNLNSFSLLGVWAYLLKCWYNNKDKMWIILTVTTFFQNGILWAVVDKINALTRILFCQLFKEYHLIWRTHTLHLCLPLSIHFPTVRPRVWEMRHDSKDTVDVRNLQRRGRWWIGWKIDK